jgi:hypothetical protein
MRVFLAGSIEMGAAEPWQDKLIKMLEPWGSRLIFLNPRRDDWDSSWVQSADSEQFAKQVNWELCHLEYCDIIAMYFDPATKSPITLLELGLFARQKAGGMIVCCRDGFWRKGNVDVVCRRYHVSQVDSLEEMVGALKYRLGQFSGR